VPIVLHWLSQLKMVVPLIKFAVGDNVVITFEETPGFLKELGMQNKWYTNNRYAAYKNKIYLHFTFWNNRSAPDLGVMNGNRFVAKAVGTETITASIKYNGTEVKTSEIFAKHVNVIASTNDGNLPINTIDRDPDTRWSASGDPQWLLQELDKEYTIDKISILFYSGDQRSSRFDLEVSTDGINYTPVLTNVNKQSSSCNRKSS
jgi:hypothetical protein